MNSNTPSRTATSARRALPALAIVALVVGLTACQTPSEGTVVVKAHVEVPAVVDGERPSDLIAAQMERQALQAQADAQAHAMAKRFEGVPADRIEEQLQKAAQARRLANLPSWTGRVMAQAAHDAEVAQLQQRFAGLPVDRIAEILQREKDLQDALTAAAHRAGSTPVGAE